MARRATGHQNLETTAIPGTAVLLTAILLAAGCATYRVPPISHTIPDAQQKACDEFARGEIRRLGESVPLELAKGLMAGLVLDVVRASAAVAAVTHHGEVASLPTPLAITEGLTSASGDSANVPSAIHLLPWSLIGGPQLARDAARTNEDVYDQAIQTCVAPIRLARQFGPDDARVAISLELLATCYVWQDQHAHAEPLRRQARVIWETVFGPNDVRVARALEDHAAVLRHLHRAPEADALQTRAAGIRAQARTLAPLVTVPHPGSLKPSCDSAASAAIFVLCRHENAPPGT